MNTAIVEWDAEAATQGTYKPAADREPVIAAITAPGSKARNERGA